MTCSTNQILAKWERFDVEYTLLKAADRKKPKNTHVQGQGSETFQCGNYYGKYLYVVYTYIRYITASPVSKKF